MSAEVQLQMQALDIDSMDWEDLQREVVTGDPDVQVPPFRKGVEIAFPKSCSCEDCYCGCC